MEYEPATYVAIQDQTEFNIPFEYVKASNVIVSVNGNQLAIGIGYTVDGSTVTLSVGSTAGDMVVISRLTAFDEDALEFEMLPGTRLTANNIVRCLNQAVHQISEVTQENTGPLDPTKNLSDLGNADVALVNIGSQNKASALSTINNSLGKANNLSDLTDVAAARANLLTYSGLESITRAQAAYDANLAGEFEGVIITTGPYSRVRMNVRLYVLDNGLYDTVLLNSYMGNFVWCNDSDYIFYSTRIPITGWATDSFHAVYLSVDVDGGFMLFNSTDTPVLYRGMPCVVVGGKYFPLVGHIYIGSDGEIKDVFSYYNPYTVTRNFEEYNKLAPVPAFMIDTGGVDFKCSFVAYKDTQYYVSVAQVRAQIVNDVAYEFVRPSISAWVTIDGTDYRMLPDRGTVLTGAYGVPGFGRLYGNYEFVYHPWINSYNKIVTFKLRQTMQANPNLEFVQLKGITFGVKVKNANTSFRV